MAFAGGNQLPLNYKLGNNQIVSTEPGAIKNETGYLIKGENIELTSAQSFDNSRSNGVRVHAGVFGESGASSALVAFLAGAAVWLLLVYAVAAGALGLRGKS